MQYDFNLNAGTSQSIDVRGRFFKYKSGTGPIRIRTSLGGAMDLLPGQGAENIDFTSLTVTDRSGAANVGVILAGDFDFRDDRISGIVEVVDGGKTRTLAGIAYMGAMNGAGSATDTINLQLWNPAGSGKNVVLGAMLAGSSVANGLRAMLTSVALTDNIDTPANKKWNGPAAVAQLRRQLNPSQMGSQTLLIENVPPGVPCPFKFTEPVLLVPGSGLIVSAGSLNTDMAVSFEWYEEKI